MEQVFLMKQSKLFMLKLVVDAEDVEAKAAYQRRLEEGWREEGKI
jgi:hypothetical protein